VDRSIQATKSYTSTELGESWKNRFNRERRFALENTISSKYAICKIPVLVT
jgi:hypothetical protein